MSTAHTDRTQINQANAQHSTGPKTDAGKQRSSLNALRHGLTGQIVVMPTEDLEAYQSHLQSFTDEYHPKGATEAHLVQALADASWRLIRVAALESNVLALGVTSDDPLKNAISIAAALESQTKALSNLSMHSQRLSRQFEKAVAQLRDIQNTRRSQEQKELEKIVDIIRMHDSNGETYDPTKDGFVFSKQEINTAIIAHNRERRARKAYEHRVDSAGLSI